MTKHRTAAVAALALLAVAALPARSADQIAPKVAESGMHYQPWFLESFLDLSEDLGESAKAGKRFVVVFEQAGCIYCNEMHDHVLSDKRINDYVRTNFNVLQLNLWGDREVTDLDGAAMSEKALARKWGVVFTPTFVFLPESVDAAKGQNGAKAEVARMPGAFKKGTFLAMFEWVNEKAYASGEHFQKYLGRKIAQYKKEGFIGK